MTIEVNRIYKGDCLKLMKEIPDNFVDCIITDPPYGIDYQSAWRTESERFNKIQSDDKPFIWWLWDAYRVLKADSCLICFCRWDVQEDFKKAIEWAGFKIKSQIIWDREIHGLGDLNGQFAPRHDVVWFATKGNYKFQNGRPQSVLKYQRVNVGKLVHPTEKPIKLLRHLVKTLTNENDIVLEPFVGSGSTTVACKELNRKYIGFEIQQEYVDIANKRLNQKTLSESLL